MTESRTRRSTFLLTITCMMGLVVAQPSFASTAENTTEVARSDGDIDANTHDLVQGAHVEGHIAFLRAELGITSAQESLWMPVAGAMREDVRNTQEAETRVSQRQRPDNAIEYLENRSFFAALRAQGEARFLAAFRPLYSTLSSQQKQVADELLMPDTGE